MKVVVLNSRETDKIIEHFVAYGFDDFIAFGRTEREYYSLNDIKVTEIYSKGYEESRERLMKIRGSLTDGFIIAYSSSVYEFDLEELVKKHHQSQGIATVAVWENKLCAAVLEPEVFDYLEKMQSLEREVLVKIGQDGEMNVQKAFKEKVE